jgi:hypothetical protein
VVRAKVTSSEDADVAVTEGPYNIPDGSGLIGSFDPPVRLPRSRISGKVAPNSPFCLLWDAESKMCDARRLYHSRAFQFNVISA